MSTVLKVITESLCYPSGDNCQPFYFRILSEEEFLIQHDSERAEHHLNKNNAASLISLGCLMEVIRVVAGQYQMVPDFEASEGALSEQESFLVKVKLKKAEEARSEVDKQLYTWLKLRWTDRRSYYIDPLPAGEKAWIQEQAGQFPHLKVQMLDRLAPELMMSILSFEQSAWLDWKLLRDLLKFIRFNLQERVKTRDGMPWAGLGLPFYMMPIFQLLSKSQFLVKIAVLMGVPAAARRSLTQLLMKSGGFGFISAPDLSANNLVDVGQLTCRIWIYLCGRGYSFQPMTMCTLMPPLLRPTEPPDYWLYSAKMDGEVLQASLYGELRLPNDFQVIWGFRTGRSGKITPDLKTLRRATNDVISRNMAKARP